MSPEGEECRAFCIGMGIHHPYLINTGFPGGKTVRGIPEYFSPSRREEFRDYLGKAFFPAMACALAWLDAGYRFSVSISGLAADQILEHGGEAHDVLLQVMGHPCSEILGQTYHHSVAGLFRDKGEFIAQVRRHADLMEELSGKQVRVFENTQFEFNSEIAKVIRELGFSAFYSEGYDHLLSARNPNTLYSCRGLPVLLRNCRLSEDLADRYFDRTWDQYPLTPETYASWVAHTPGDCVHIFLDASTFSGPPEDADRFRDFLSRLPEALQSSGVATILPSDAVQGTVRGELPLEDLGLCLPDGTCCLTGIQNILQQSAFWCLEDGQLLVTDREAWRKLQSIEHFMRMTLRSGSCGRTVSHWTIQDTQDYFSAYMRILAHMESRSAGLHRSRVAARALRCLPPEHAFHFSTGQRYTGYSAHSLAEFGRLLEFVPAAVFSFHQERGDFSRWIREMLGDTTLASRLAGCSAPGEARAMVTKRLQELCRRIR